MTSLLQILLFILDIASLIVLVHVIMSWLIGFRIINPRQPLVAQIWMGLNSLLDPVYDRIRSLLPAMRGIDLAPLITLIILYAIRVVLQNNAGLFM